MGILDPGAGCCCGVECECPPRSKWCWKSINWSTREQNKWTDNTFCIGSCKNRNGPTTKPWGTLSCTSSTNLWMQETTVLSEGICVPGAGVTLRLMRCREDTGASRPKSSNDPSDKKSNVADTEETEREKWERERTLCFIQQTTSRTPMINLTTFHWHWPTNNILTILTEQLPGL